jgi:hypothetical protein
MRIFTVGLAAVLLCVGSARAEWLTDAWDDEFVKQHGNPAITLNGGGAIVVLQDATLNAARAAGLSDQDIVLAFLQRYGQCSELLDLQKPRAQLRVRLSIQRQLEVADARGETQEDILNSARAIEKEIAGDNEQVPALLIDYVPGSRKKRCSTGPAMS